MALEELRKKVLYQNSIEIWIGISEEKNIDWVDTENYKKFIAFLLKNKLNMKQMSICFLLKELKYNSTTLTLLPSPPFHSATSYYQLI